MLLFNITQPQTLNAENAPCPNCGCNQYKIKNNSRILRFSFIPVMPITFRFQSVCNDCQYSQPMSFWQLTTTQILAQTRYYCGLLIFIALIGLFIHKQLEQQAQQQKYLNAPKLYDNYIVLAEEFTGQAKRVNNLKVLQIVDISANHISFRVGNFTYKHFRDIEIAMRTSLLVQDNYFASQTLTFSKNKVQQLFKQGAVERILRPNLYSLFGGFVMHPPKPKPLYTGVKLDKNNQQGIDYFKDGLYPDALASFLLSAESGYAWGQLNLAQMYRDGQGTEVNLEQAAYWLKQAAQQGNHKAKVQLKDLCSNKQSITLPEC